MSLNGLILTNKPTGITSTDVVRVVRKSFNMRQVGHTGTLDLLATGLLVVGVGRATKAIEYLQRMEKTYRVSIQFQVEKDTIDNEGKIINTTDVMITKEQLEDSLKCFIGELKQVPPMHSAIRHDGKRLYQLARQNITVDRKERDIKIFSNELIEFDYESQYAVIDLTVSSGTYIRSFVNDLAKKLGTLGFMDNLVRIRCSGFDLDDSISITNDISSSQLMNSFVPMNEIFPRFKSITVTEEESKRLKNGMTIVLNNRVKNGFYKVIVEDNLLGVTEIYNSEKGSLLKLSKHLYI